MIPCTSTNRGACRAEERWACRADLNCPVPVSAGESSARGVFVQLPAIVDGGEPIRFWLYKNVEDHAVLIDRSPEIVSDAVDLEKDLVQMPFCRPKRAPFQDAYGVYSLPNFSHERRTVS